MIMIAAAPSVIIKKFHTVEIIFANVTDRVRLTVFLFIILVVYLNKNVTVS